MNGGYSVICSIECSFATSVKLLDIYFPFLTPSMFSILSRTLNIYYTFEV